MLQLFHEITVLQRENVALYLIWTSEKHLTLCHMGNKHFQWWRWKLALGLCGDKNEMAGYTEGTVVIMGPFIIKLLFDLAENKIMLKKVY